MFAKSFLFKESSNPHFLETVTKERGEAAGIDCWSIIDETISRYRSGEKGLEGRLYSLYLLLSWIAIDEKANSNLPFSLALFGEMADKR